jgi:hypothetical protein
MHHDRAALPPFDAVSLDVGGVLIMPDQRMVSRALARAGVRHDPARFFDGHYRAMAEVDRRRPRPEEFGATTITSIRSPISLTTRWRRVDRSAERAISSPDVRFPGCRAVS